MQPQHEVAGVLNAHWPAVQQSARFNSWQLRTLHAVRRCRTAALGVHVDGCTSCGHLRISYCVEDDTIERALPGFERVAKRYRR